MSGERREVFQHVKAWPEGWAGFEKPWGPEGEVDMEAFAAAFDEELRREVAPGHPLHGRRFLAIGKREATDDVLFATAPGAVAVVHLTWARKPERPPWPWTTQYASFAEFIAALPEDFGE